MFNFNQKFPLLLSVSLTYKKNIWGHEICTHFLVYINIELLLCMHGCIFIWFIVLGEAESHGRLHSISYLSILRMAGSQYSIYFAIYFTNQGQNVATWESQNPRLIITGQFFLMEVTFKSYLMASKCCSKGMQSLAGDF